MEANGAPAWAAVVPGRMECSSLAVESVPMFRTVDRSLEWPGGRSDAAAVAGNRRWKVRVADKAEAVALASAEVAAPDMVGVAALVSAAVGALV